jgi:selenide,water dikinase
MDLRLPKHDIVLLGAGHTNAHLLRMWKMQPIADARLTCVSNFPVATYSGMLPGVLAELYEPAAMQIDLVRLCAAAGVRFICSNVTEIAADSQQLIFDDRPPLPFDSLSIGIGSVPNRAAVDATGDTILPIKPMQTFLARFKQRLNSIGKGRSDATPIRVAIVGGGAAGVELAFCIPAFLERLNQESSHEICLIDANARPIRGMRDKTVDLLERELRARGVDLRLGKKVSRVSDGVIQFDDSTTIDADVVLWATGAVAPALLANCDLPKDERGFLLTQPTLQSIANDAVFAVGDSGTIEQHPTPKAGVYAVRQGPVLWENLQRRVRGETLEEYRPQHSFLKMLNLGDGTALADYRGTTWRGRWCWRLKDRIDRRFMAMYQDYQPKEMIAAPVAETPAMRCAGCGGKVGGDVLSRVLKRLKINNNEHVLVGLDAPDDVAILRGSGDQAICATTDFFAAPLDDPYFVGRIAALNAISDVFAVAGKPTAALAHVTLPVGPSAKQEQLLFELLAGALREFDTSNTSIVGGHTIEGPQLTIGFTVLGHVNFDRACTKDDLRAGDVLVLTKPLGSGVLLAAHMQARCKAEWMQPLLDTMLASNQAAAALVDEFKIGGLTDVTGFGLAGHLLEMLSASDLAAELKLNDLPLLPGAASLINDGIESTLSPANRAAEREIEVSEPLRKSAAYAALFDPQTSGGLLLGVDPQRVPELLARLDEITPCGGTVIGCVQTAAGNARRISIS